MGGFDDHNKEDAFSADHPAATVAILLSEAAARFAIVLLTAFALQTVQIEPCVQVCRKRG